MEPSQTNQLIFIQQHRSYRRLHHISYIHTFELVGFGLRKIDLENSW